MRAAAIFLPTEVSLHSQNTCVGSYPAKKVGTNRVALGEIETGGKHGSFKTLRALAGDAGIAINDLVEYGWPFAADDYGHHTAVPEVFGNAYSGLRNDSFGISLNRAANN